MNWRTEPLRRVAPPQASTRRFGDSDEAWHLNLDQIEAQTGRILARKHAPAAEAGGSTFVFDEGNVLYSKLRPYLNKVVRPSGVGIATTELVPLRPVPGVLDADFLTYFLRSSEFVAFASTCVAGVKMPRVIMDKLWQHPVPLPPPSEQRRMVELLEQADALRRLRAEANAKAERILPALFLKMFGDPATNPKGWDAAALGTALLDSQYGTSTRANSEGHGVAVLRMNNITSRGHLDLRNLKHVELSDKDVSKYLLEPGDLLFNRTNSTELVGKTALWQGQFEAVAASYLIRVRVDRAKALPEFVWAYMNTDFMKRVLFDKARRAIGMANINAQELKRLPFYMPSIKRQQEFAAVIDDIMRNRSVRQKATIEVEGLFQSLVHRAFAGSLTASWREAHIKELLPEMEQQARYLAGATSPEVRT